MQDKAAKAAMQRDVVMTVGSLFSGIGGLDLGLEWAGMRIVWQVENNPFRQAVLAKHWPEVKRYGDIRTIDPTELEPVDLVCGGPPCQPVSLAGKRRGKEDDRWLWDEAIRIVTGLRPRWCLFENPTGIVSMGLDDVLSRLEALGYSCWAAVIPACAVGAPHRRDRVWIVAHSTGVECQPGAEEQGALRRVPADGQKRGYADGSGEAQSGEDVAYAEGAERQWAGVARNGRDGLADGGGWEDQSGVGGVFNGPANRLDGFKGGINPCKKESGSLLHANTADAPSPSKLAQNMLTNRSIALCVGMESANGYISGDCRQSVMHKWPAPLGCEQYDWEPPRLAQGEDKYRGKRIKALGDAIVPQVAEAIGRAIVQAHLESLREVAEHGG